MGGNTHEFTLSFADFLTIWLQFEFHLDGHLTGVYCKTFVSGPVVPKISLNKTLEPATFFKLFMEKTFNTSNHQTSSGTRKGKASGQGGGRCE